MDAAFWFEVVGYAASGLIALSILQQSILRLRIIGFVGSVVGVVYGLLIVAYPVALLHLRIALIHIFRWRRLVRTDEEMISFLATGPGDAYLESFTDFHADDLEQFFPDGLGLGEDSTAVFLLRDAVPAGLFVARREGADLVVGVDYVVPRYRDLVLGRHLFANLDEVLDTEGLERVVAGPGIAEHERYLTRMGFGPDGSGRWVLPL